VLFLFICTSDLLRVGSEVINDFCKMIYPDLFQSVEALGTCEARATGSARKHPELFLRLHLPAFETETHRIVIHAALIKN